MKKTLALLLVLVMMFSIFIPTATAQNATSVPADFHGMTVTYAPTANPNVFALEFRAFNVTGNTFVAGLKYNDTVIKPVQPNGNAIVTIKGAVSGMPNGSAVLTGDPVFQTEDNMGDYGWAVLDLVTRKNTNQIYISMGTSISQEQEILLEQYGILGLGKSIVAPESGLGLFKIYFSPVAGKTMADVKQELFTLWTDAVQTDIPHGVSIIEGVNGTLVGEDLMWLDFPHTIVSNAGNGGTIAPLGTVLVNDGANKAYKITANPGNEIDSISVNGITIAVPADATEYTYNFVNVKSNQTITATFKPASGPAPIVYHEITATNNNGGSITPSGGVLVVDNASQNFVITPATGYEIQDVLVDNVSVGAVSSYRFDNVTADHTIRAVFKVTIGTDPVDEFTVKATAGQGGVISPNGTTYYSVNATPSFTITPDTNYKILSVTVNGADVKNQLVNNTYTFDPLDGNKTINATFKDFFPPVIITPEDGAVTNDNTPTISGTGEPGATVTVTVKDENGTPVDTGTALVDEDGNWTYTPTNPLPDKDLVITAIQEDEEGNVSERSDPVEITIDTEAPDAPGIDPITDNDDKITGTGDPGDKIVVTFPGGETEETTVDEDGKWEVPVPPGVDLKPGDEVSVVETDPAGNSSEPETETVVRSTPIEAPVITGPADGTLTNDNTPTITGTGEPNATVTVTVKDENGTPVGTGTAVVDEDGNWTYTPTNPLPDGDLTITAIQTDPVGNASPESNEVNITVDTEAPDAPVITSPEGGDVTNDNTPTITGTGEPGSTVTVEIEDEDGIIVDTGEAVVDEDGNWTYTPTNPLPDGELTITVTQEDEAGNVSEPSDPVVITVDTEAPSAPVITSPTNGSSTNNKRVPITGTCEAGATVTVTLDGVEYPATVTGTTWSYTPATDLADGSHAVSAKQADQAGNVSPASDTVNFTVDTDAPAAPVITSPTNGSYTTNKRVPIIGTCEAGATVTVTLDGVEYPAIVTGTTWSYTPATDLADTEHTVSAKQADQAGNVSPSSDTVKFTVDTQAPAAPVITSPTEGEIVTSTTPTIKGTGEPGATVTVTIEDEDGTPVDTGTALVDNQGKWEYTPATALPEGEVTVSATQKDKAGNTSPSTEVTFTIDQTKYYKVSGVVTYNGGILPATVKLYNSSNAVVGTATVSKGNTFTIEDVVDGTYTLIAHKKNHTKATVYNVVVNGSDVVITQTLVLYAGDLDESGDNVINGIDRSLMFEIYNTANTMRDINEDGVINGIDRSIMFENYNKAGMTITLP